MVITAQSNEIEQFAKIIHENDDSIDMESLAKRIEDGILKADEDIKNGRYMDLETFKKKLYSMPLKK